MSRTEESRRRRREKAKRTNIITSVVILAIVLILVVAIKAFSGGSDKPKKPSEEKKITDVKKNEKKQKDDKKKDKGPEDKKKPEESIEDEKDKKEEKQKIEAERKEKYGEFYVPLPEKTKEARDVKVKGLYVTQTTAAYDFNEDNIKRYEDYIRYVNGESETGPDSVEDINKLERILAICNATEINGLVIDIKSDDGYITWNSDIDVVNNLGTAMPASQDNFENLIKYMKEHDIYPMARIVVFKDFILPELKPEHAMQLNAGGIYTDDQGMPWVNQYDKFVWDYVVATSKEAALRGFEEIHFDYIRFPDNAAHYNEIVNFPGRDGKRKDQNIQDFIKYAKEELKPYGVKVGAAVFGIITRSWEDQPEDIGQTWIKITKDIDIISPMIYPSHYSTGWYGYDYPDAHPYGVFFHSLREAVEKNSSVENPAKIRPWIQGFTAPWVDGHIEYTPEVIAEQVKAGVELGIDEYLVWNAVNEYEPMTFKATTGFVQDKEIDPNNLPEYTNDMLQSERDGAEASLVDKLDRSPYAAIANYLNALSNGYSDEVYLLTKRSERADNFEEFNNNFKEKALGLGDFSVNNVKKNDKGYEFSVDGNFLSVDGQAVVDSLGIQVVLEDGIFKIIPPQLKYEQVQVTAEDSE
ncbi:MAG: putative glycoside hydrolase [Tissierellia bacterium]|nr:putative glycoside hydrolase [Tissierellia bacterium]